MKLTLLRPISIALTGLALATSCAEPEFDTTRKTSPRGTLGEEIFKLFDDDMQRETPRRAEGFESEKAGFVAAIDHMFPDAELKDTQDFLVRLLPLYDDQTIPGATEKLAGVLERLKADADATQALAAIENRSGYVSLKHAEALERRIATYPRYRELSNKLIDLALAHDGLDAHGNKDATEDAAISSLLKSVTDGMKDLTISEDAERTIVLVANLLTSDDPRFASSAPTTAPSGPSSYVARDYRGMAQVAAPRNGGMPAPFVDQAPADGLPDIDSDGRFIDARGKPINLPPFGAGGDRDTSGRAVAAPGGPTLYQYVSTDTTMLAGVLRDGKTLIANDIHNKGLDTLELFLGDRGADGKYTAAGNKLIDLAYAVSTIVDGREIPDLLDVGTALVGQHEATIAYLLSETRHQFDVADRHNVSLKTGNTFFDDLMRVIRKILQEPGLAEDLVRVLEDPAVLGLPAAATTLSDYKHPLITEADFNAGRCFVTHVDRTQPDTRANQSLQQRLFHLIFDTRKARYEPHFIGIPLGFIFAIDDQAEFYLLSVIGKAEVPSLVATLTGLDTHPTPDQLAVFLNSDQTFGNPSGNEGVEVRQNDGDTLYAASASGMIAALKPLIQTFYDHGKLDLLFELFEVLHLHWASPEGGDYQNQARNQPRYSYLSGIARYEPMLIDIFTTTHVLKAAQNLLVEGHSITTHAGHSLSDTLLVYARRFLLKDTTLRTRDNQAQVMIDGKRETPLSPFDLLRAARSDIKATTRLSNKASADWQAIVDNLDDLFMQTESTGPEAGRFKNARLVPVATTLTSFLADRARKQATLGTLPGWTRRELVKNLEDGITSEELPAIVDLIHIARNDQAFSDMMVELRDQMLDENQGFPELLALIGDQLQASKDASVAVPFLRFLGREMDPDQKLPFTMLNLLKQTLAADPSEKMLEVARRGIEEVPTSGGLYLYGLGRAIRQANRQNPLEQGPLDAVDIQGIVGSIQRYLVDPEHGLEKFYAMVKNR
ncbi:MAG: hypothetical protein U1E65_15820 [Myxococcota bacterium]